MFYNIEIRVVFVLRVIGKGKKPRTLNKLERGDGGK
jgi:hypothetical protein